MQRRPVLPSQPSRPMDGERSLRPKCARRGVKGSSL
jgi:hypothetical protein